MSTPLAVRGLFSLSLRELLALVAFAGLACVSLKFANDWYWVGLSSVAMMSFMAAVVVACVGRGEGQAFAIGFLICLTLYGGFLLFAGRERELNIYAGTMPTTRLMRTVYDAIATKEYLVIGNIFATEAEAAAYLAKFQASLGDGPADPDARAFALSFASRGVETSTKPDILNYTSIAHLWWAMLLSYLGGRFARWVYARRTLATA